MSWLQLLSETYDNILKLDEEERRGLLPIAHSTQKAHVTVVIDQEGNFLRGEFVADVEGKEKNLSQTLIPVTEKSASRGNGINPHPLADKFKYVAGDYSDYCNDTNEDYYTAYVNQLEEWSNSEDSTPKVKAILTYIRKGSLIGDLVTAGVLSLNEEGVLTDKWENAAMKLTTGNQIDGFVRFEIIDDSKHTKTWQDIELQKVYINYYFSSQNDKYFCYVKGEELGCSDNHPSKVRHSGDKAKLISANDSSGFTFRGRFKSSDEAVKISYEVSQKAHNALKHLISTQGERIGEKAFLLFGTGNEDTPALTADSLSFYEDDGDEFDTLEAYAKQLGKAMNGYKAKVTPYTTFAIIGLDAATTGRMAIIYYREYRGDEVVHLLERIENWHQTSSWLHFYKGKNKGRHYFYGAPSPYDIALCAYGTEQGDFLGGNDKVLANTVERILPCISDKAKIPRDIVQALVRKCFSPQCYEKTYNWSKVLSITCAMYRKYLYDYKGEVVEMKVDENSKDISYQCGRLLAVADAIENYALREQSGGSAGRTTNAMRYFNRFTRFPNDTWRIINEKLVPYMERLGSKGNHLYALKQEISNGIDPDIFAQAKNLDGRMALGFDSQKQQLYENMRKSSKEKNSEEE